MNEKISFPDLVTLLAAKLNVTKKEAEAFLKEFFTVSTEVISSGEELKINELGVFKPIWVEPRASVNVQTGEPVEIPGHYKLSFVPDKGLREAVNAPFSSFSVEILNDHVSTEEMMAVGDDELPDSREAEEEPAETEEAAPADEMAVQEPIPPVGEAEAIDTETGVGENRLQEAEGDDAEPQPAEAVAEAEPVEDSPETTDEVRPEEEQPEELLQIEPVTTPQETEPDDTTEPEQDEEEHDYNEYLQKSASRRAFWWGALSGLGLVAVICAAAWFFLRDEEGIKIGEYTLLLSNSETFAPRPVVNNPTDTAVISEPVDTAVVAEVDDNDTVSRVAVETNRIEPEPEAKQPRSEATLVEEKPVAEPVVETIRSGVFLTTLARKYFGHKTFWVYIYEENKQVIDNPNQVPIGTRVVIPEAAKYHIDAKDSRSVEKAKALAVQILSRYE